MFYEEKKQQEKKMNEFKTELLSLSKQMSESHLSAASSQVKSYLS